MPKDDPRYEMPVNKMEPERLKRALESAMKGAALASPTGTGIIVFMFDLGQGGGIGYISNAHKMDCIAMLEEWIEHVRSQS